MATSVLIIDGNTFRNFDGFVRAFNKACEAAYAGGSPFNPAGSAFRWGGNLDAFRDYITIEDPLIFVWLNADRSRRKLGHKAYAKRKKDLLKTCHPSNIPKINEEIAQARLGQGPTLFDEITSIIGTVADQVTLELR